MAADMASSSEMNDGPVLSVINKRLRALRKKQNRILQMEESLAQGKTLNKEQEETLRSKFAVLAGIDELEKLRQPLMAALSQEISLALEKLQNPETPMGEHLIEENTAEETRNTEEKKQVEPDGVSEISDLLNLLYFGSMFDVKTLMLAHENMLTRTHERNCCLTYDYVTDDDADDPLKDLDFDLISMLASSLVSRPVDSSLSHKDALQKCVQHAKLWLANADQPIELNSSVTYAGLREKLNKILASDYSTTTPKMKAPVEMTAAAAGSYSSFQVPVHGSVVQLNVPVQVESSAAEYQQEEEESLNFHGGIYYDEAGPVEDHQESDLPAQTEVAIADSEFEQKSRDLESKELQYHPRRSHQNYRGGHRGYSNGRGGRGRGRGGYPNGRNQFYDQPSNYNSRNYNYRGRGGMGGNSNYHASTGYSGHVQAES